MQDFVPLGTGNSRYLKSIENFLSVYPTYESMVAALVAGTLPVDFNGINEAGISQKGNPLNSETLLKVATATLLGGDETMVPDEALVALKTMLDGISASSIGAARIELGSYTGNGVNAGTAKTLTFSFKPKVVIIAGPGSYVTSKFGTAIFMQGAVNSKIDIGGASGSETVSGSLYDLTWSGNSVTWKGRGSSSAEYCLNKSGATYYYVAID